MVTVLRTPVRPTVSRPATCTHGVTYEEPDCAFCEGRVRRHRHRIRPDCSRYFARDHRYRERPRNQPEHQVHLDQHLAEISGGYEAGIEGLGDAGAFVVSSVGNGVAVSGVVVRKPGVAAVAASKVSLPSGNPDRASVE